MSLLLGNIGRAFLSRAMQSEVLCRVGIGAGKMLHSVAPSYTPGLTIETYRLWDTLSRQGVLSENSMPQEIQIKVDGFYLGKEKISGNQDVSQAFFRTGTTSLSTDQIIGPENLANLPRGNSFVAMHYLQTNLIPGIFMGLSASAAYEGSNWYLLGTALSYLFTSSFRGFVDKFRNLLIAIEYTDSRLHWPRPQFGEIEKCRPEIVPYFSNTECPTEGFALGFLPSTLFVNTANFPLNINLAETHHVFHEKAHLLGASEEEAFFMQAAYRIKAAMSQGNWMQALKAEVSSLFSCFSQTRDMLGYLSMARTSYFGYSDPSLLLANRGHKKELQLQLSQFESEGKTISRRRKRLEGRAGEYGQIVPKAQNKRLLKELLALQENEAMIGMKIIILEQIFGHPYAASKRLQQMVEVLGKAGNIALLLEEEAFPYLEMQTEGLAAMAHLYESVNDFGELENILTQMRALFDGPSGEAINIENKIICRRLEAILREHNHALTA